MVEPFISVVIVSYNYGKYLPRALEACQKQTFRDFEIVMVDNGSTDHTDEIIQTFMKENPGLAMQHIRIEQNIGLPNGRNHGIEAARGMYILFNDADDWMDVNCLEKLAHEAKATDADRITSDLTMVSGETCTPIKNLSYSNETPKYFFHLLQGSIFKTEIFRKHTIQVPLDVIYDDVWISITFANFASLYQHVSKCLYFKYEHEDFKSFPTNFDRLRGEYAEIKSIYNQMEDHEARTYLEYLCIKLYFVEIYHTSKKKRFSELCSNYKVYHSQLADCFPNYKKNGLTSLFTNNHDNAFSQKAIACSILAEKLHVFPLLLCVYGLLSNFVDMPI